MWPHRRQPTRLPRPWDSQDKNTGVGCHFLLQCMKVKSEREVIQSCPTLHNPTNWSLPGSSVHGIFQARVLEWGAIALGNHSFDYKDICWQMIFLIFNMLSRFVIAFLPRRKHLLISWLQSRSAVILEPRKLNLSLLSLVSPSICQAKTHLRRQKTYSPNVWDTDERKTT